MNFGIFAWILLILLAIGGGVGAWVGDPWGKRAYGGAWLLLVLLLACICVRLWPWQ